MIIPVTGFDPSLTHWGIAEANLCLETGYLDTPALEVIEPEELTGKQVRNNSNDLFRAEQLAVKAISVAQRSKVIFVEVPHGSQSARAMASYGVCVGILSSIRALGIPIIEVSALEVKTAFTGSKTATKELMISTGLNLYPNANWPIYQKDGKNFKKGEIHSKAEHVADAIAAIHAGVQTSTFMNLMRLFAKV